MMQFTFLQLLDETLSRYEQINESSSRVNVGWVENLIDSCVETLIPENDDFFPKCDNLSRKGYRIWRNHHFLEL